MVERVLVLKESLMLAFSQIEDLESLTSSQWIMAKDIVSILSPVEACTRILCGEKYCSISMIIPTVRSTLNKLEKLMLTCVECKKVIINYIVILLIIYTLYL